MIDKEPIHFYCRVQNRLGAIDRVLGALTHRGILPEKLNTTRCPDQSLEIRISFILKAEKAVADKFLEKLTRFLQKQVYVLDAFVLPSQTAQKVEKNDFLNVLAPSFVSNGLSEATHQRRILNAHNA